MLILDFKIDSYLVENNIVNFLNTLRTLVYQEDESLLELIDVSDDDIFLEPTLFYYYAAKENNLSKMPILQILWGYMANDARYSLLNIFC